MKRPVHIPLYALFLFIFLIAGQAVRSQTSYTWNGSVSTDWNTPANWTPGGVPGAADNVTIVTGSNTCLLNASAAITNFKLTNGILDLGGNTLTINGTTAAYSAGTVQNGTMTVAAASNTAFGNGPVTMNCIVNVTSDAVTLKSTIFQKALTLTKTGSSNDVSAGGNVFNDITVMNNTGSGYLTLGAGGPDQFNAAVTFNNTGSNNLYIAYNSTNNIFGGAVTFNNASASGTGIFVGYYSPGTAFNDNIIVTADGNVHFQHVLLLK